MVALRNRKSQPRHYSIGPLSEDRPLKLYEPPTQVPWWIDLAMAVGFIVVVLVPAAAAVVLAFGAW